MDDKENITKTQAVNKPGADVKKKPDNPYLVVFGKPYTFEGKEYTQIDLSGMKGLRPSDFFDASKSFNMEEYINPRPEAEPKFCCDIAGRAAGLPVEFFEDLPIRDVRKIRNCVQDFFREED